MRSFAMHYLIQTGWVVLTFGLPLIFVYAARAMEPHIGLLAVFVLALAGTFGILKVIDFVEWLQKRNPRVRT